MNNENNKMQVDIENLFKQNVNDLSAIKELYRKLKEVEEKFSQIKYFDSTLAYKLKKEYEKLKKIILDENAAASLANDIETLNEKLTNDIELINTKLTDDIESINSQLDTIVHKLTFIDKMKLKTVYGAKGDGVTDDTQAFLRCIKNENIIYIPEGIYLISQPLYINVETQCIIGEGSRSKLKQDVKFPSGGVILTFYSSNGSYQTRHNRVNKHGNFSIEGIKEQKNVDGIKFGGDIGSIYEGHVDQQIFENIFISFTRNRILYGSHCYKCLCINISGHENIYDLKSSDNQIDAGEVMTFLNSTFWSGMIDIKKKCQFVSCTIHPQIITSQKGSLCFFNETYVFTNCHFEILSAQGENITEYSTMFYANNANVTFDNCDATINNGITLTNSCFVTEGKINAHIFVNGGNWRYFLTRLKTSATIPLCKGNVEINNQYTPNLGTNYLTDVIYSDTIDFISKNYNDDYDFITLGSLKNKTLNITTTTNGININATKDLGGYCGVMKIVPCINKKGGIYKANLNLNIENSIYKYQIKSGQNEQFSIGFLDKNKNIIKTTDNVNELEQTQCTSIGQNISVKHIFGIPNNACYVMYGIGYQHSGTDQFNIDINSCTLELW